MEAIIFEVVTKATLFLAAIIAFIVWMNAGFPMWTITRR